MYCTKPMKNLIARACTTVFPLWCATARYHHV